MLNQETSQAFGRKDIFMNTSHHTRLLAILLFGLPLLSNAISFVIFAPLFDPGRSSTNADFRSASIWIGVSLLVVELGALMLIVRALRRENLSLKNVINFQGERLRRYLSVSKRILRREGVFLSSVLCTL